MLDALLPSWMRRYRPGDERRVEPPEPARLRALMPAFGRLARLFRYEIEGLEHIPADGPALVVSHHPLVPLGAFLLSFRVLERDGRTFRGLTQHEAFLIPGLRDIFTSLGIVDGNQDNAERLLASGQLAFAMPGGALEWSRSSRLRRTLRWGEHRGYARLAVRTGTPVIPIACPASDDLYRVLVDGHRIARALDRLVSTPRPLTLPVAVGLGPLPFPVRLTQYVTPPIAPPAEGSFDERVRALDGAVRARIRALLRRP